MNFENLIGNTPILEVKGIELGQSRLFLKLECQNPGGSIKDRIALYMISDAERNGILKPGGTIVEATAGNTGLGLALVAAQKGYKCILVVPDKMSREKIAHIQALGAEVKITRSDVLKGHPEYYQDLAKSIADTIQGAWYVDQFSNLSNPKAHEETTGPEIWKQMDGKVDAIVVGVGSGGTLGGLSKYFSKVNPNLNMVIADPVGSIIAPYIHTGRIPNECGSWLVEGIGEDFIPKNADFNLVKAAYSITDKESFLTAREILRTNGILVGSSSGTLISAAIKYCREQTTPKNIVTFVCDGGSKYLSKTFNDFWMVDQGFLNREVFGDIRDLIARPFATGSVISVKPTDTLRNAFVKMKNADLSQLPVIENNSIVGILDESDILFAINADKNAFNQMIKEYMTSNLKILKPTDSIPKVLSILKKGMVAIVADGKTLYGLITKIDVVDYLRRTN
jgi:cystathionine beta-synthase